MTRINVTCCSYLLLISIKKIRILNCLHHLVELDKETHSSDPV